jgi:hypothetical protein
VATTIHLSDYEYEWAAHVGIRRMIARQGSKPASHYSEKARLEDEVKATIATCCCEMAVAKVTNRYWGGHVWDARDHDKHRKIADVGANTEVRRVRVSGKAFAVRSGDVDMDRLMVAAYAEAPDYRTVTVYGYMSANDAWILGEPASFDPDHTRYTPLDVLNPL